MRFKHTINVLIDNFRVTYKLLVYLLIVILISIGLSAAIIVPFVNRLDNVEYFANIVQSFNTMLDDIVHGNLSGLASYFESISANFNELITYLGDHPSDLVLSSLALIFVGLIRRFFIGLGNYTAGALINDKMAMQANSSFTGTLIKNLGEASIYSVIYLPMSFVYDVGCATILYLILFFAMRLPIMIAVLLFVVFMILLMGVKMMFTTDWLPAIICGKKSVVGGFKYSFMRESGNSGSVYSFFASSSVAILAFNVLAAIGTFGAALIITIPLSYLYLLCYEFVNYCDSNKIKYFTDKRTIVKPELEQETSREQFLRGE